MTKPALPPAWASDLNYTTGPRPGTPTKVTIPAAIANEGHRPGKLFPTPAQHMNDWLGQVSTYLQWLTEEQGTGFFGDGSDGDVTIAAPTQQLGNKNYRNLTLDDELDVDRHIVRVSGTLTINAAGSLIQATGDGANGVGAVGGAGGTVGNPPSILEAGGPGGAGGSGVGAGTAGTSVTTSEGGAGGAGGTSGPGGGAGGTATKPLISEGDIRALPMGALGRIQGAVDDSQRIQGGAGGGGGDANAVGVSGGGGGGAGGGVCVVACQKLVIVAGGKISVRGGGGGNGSGTDAGGGAGGGGGVLIVLFRDTNEVAIATMLADNRLDTRGGAGGTPGSGSGTAGGSGVAGALVALNA